MPLDEKYYENIVLACIREFERVGWHTSSLELPGDIAAALRKLAAREKELRKLRSTTDPEYRFLYTKSEEDTNA